MSNGNAFGVLARFGYAARGVVYLVLGLIALSGAIGGWTMGEEASTDGAFSVLLEQPFGRILLGLVALGLLSYGLWRMAQGVFDTDNHGHEAKAILVRTIMFGVGVANLGLAFGAAGLALPLGGRSGGGSSEQGIAATLLDLPFGRFLLGAVGLSVIVGGLIQAWRGMTRRFEKRIRLSGPHAPAMGMVCILGLVARGLLLAIVGGFLVVAALHLDASQAGGISTALDWVRGLPFGAIVYIAAALGLIAFAGYSLIQARYRRIDPPTLADVRDKVPV